MLGSLGPTHSLMHPGMPTPLQAFIKLYLLVYVSAPAAVGQSVHELTRMLIESTSFCSNSGNTLHQSADDRLPIGTISLPMTCSQHHLSEMPFC